MSNLLDPNQTFQQLFESVGLDFRLRKGVVRLGHLRPTLVQAQCLPLSIRDGRDLLVRARTGSGKTLAYSLPLLHKVLSNNSPSSEGVQGLVLVPTKELCAQVTGVLEQLCYYANDIIQIAVLTGRSSKEDRARQDAMLRDFPKLIVATPSSLLYFLRNNPSLKAQVKESVHTLVVDEADLILSFGYADEMTEIMKYLPKICQGLLMSATLSPEVQQLKKVVLHSPAIIKLEEDEEDISKKKKAKLVQFYLSLPKKDKNLALYVFLKLGLLKGKGLFFVNSTDAGYRLKLFFEQFHIRSAVLNSELPLKSRLHIIEHFNVGNFDYLIATDDGTGAADYGVSRGTDFRLVSFVVNVELPRSAEEYTHRVRRTARGGHKGVALTLVDQDSQSDWDLLQLIKKSQPSLPAKQCAGGDNGILQPQKEHIEEGSTLVTSVVQPSQLDFDLSEIEGFRYRVEDVSRAVTKAAVKEARANELKAELLNSERLQSHFEENPADLQLLQHDRISRTKLQEHLKHIPKYMLPRGMQVADLHRRRRKKRKVRVDGQRRTDNDPLQVFDKTPQNADSAFEEFFVDDESEKKEMDKEEEPAIYINTKDGTGRSTSGRNAWKEKHKKGKFSSKRKRNEPKPRRSGI